jgi:hypothetical protein
VNIPKPATGIRLQVIFDEDCTALRHAADNSCGDNEIRELDGARISCLADLDDWKRLRDVGELGTSRKNDWVRFTDNLGTSWDRDSLFT